MMKKKMLESLNKRFSNLKTNEILVMAAIWIPVVRTHFLVMLVSDVMLKLC